MEGAMCDQGKAMEFEIITTPGVKIDLTPEGKIVIEQQCCEHGAIESVYIDPIHADVIAEWILKLAKKELGEEAD